MTAPVPVVDRFHHVLADTAASLRVDPADLAGRFGLRRFTERWESGDRELQANPWLHRAARLRKDARTVSAALTRAGIRHFFFKGIALVGRLYRLEDRRLDDVDLMVDPIARNAALATLHSLGYADLHDPTRPSPATRRPGTTMCLLDAVSGEGDRAALFDVHWGLEPLNALLPAETLPLPEAVWDGIDTQRGLPVPSDEHHVALILHHLVRHDLLHVRGLLDMALLWEGLPKRGGAELRQLADGLGVGRTLGVVARVLVDDLGLFPLLGVRPGARDWRARRVLRRLRLRDWLVFAARRGGDTRRHVMVSASRAWRRFLLADNGGTAARLMRELLAPPREYLRWRWPEAPSDAAAWRRHLAAAV